MRIVIMGTGGLGGYFGVRLARAGEEVTFIARGSHLEAIRRDGLTLKSPQLGELTLPVRATDQPSEVGHVDLIVFCVKTYDLDPAAEQSAPMVGPNTIVVPVQNGVDAVERIGRVLGTEHIIRGVTAIASSIEAPGVIRHHGGKNLMLGELSRERTARLERVVDVFTGAGIDVQVPADISQVEWWKYVGICGGFGATALTRLPYGPVLAHPETLALFRGLIGEAVSVAKAVGIQASDTWIDDVQAAIASRPPWTPTSMLTDLLVGRRLELESIHGMIVRLGQEQGVPTPLNFAVYAALQPYVNGHPDVPTPP